MYSVSMMMNVDFVSTSWEVRHAHHLVGHHLVLRSGPARGRDGVLSQPRAGHLGLLARDHPDRLNAHHTLFRPTPYQGRVSIFIFAKTS